MSASKPKKTNSMADKMSLKQKNEKIINDLLLQFAYTLTICVFTIFIYNATVNISYGTGMYYATRGFSWAMVAISLIVGVLCLVLYRKDQKSIQKTVAIYSFVTALVMFWYVGVEKIPYYLQNVMPFFSNFVGTYKAVTALFPLLGIAVIAEFVVYFVRYYSVNGKKK